MNEDIARERIETALRDYKQEFGSFFIAKMLGLGISYSEESCNIQIPVDDFLFNPQGTYHGGMLATVMDISMGHLIKKVTGKAGITLEMKNQFLRPLFEGPGFCEGKFIRQGRSVSFLESRVWDVNKKLVAHGTSTWKMGIQE